MDQYIRCKTGKKHVWLWESDQGVAPKEKRQVGSTEGPGGGLWGKLGKGFGGASPTRSNCTGGSDDLSFQVKSNFFCCNNGQNTFVVVLALRSELFCIFCVVFSPKDIAKGTWLDPLGVYLIYVKLELRLLKVWKNTKPRTSHVHNTATYFLPPKKFILKYNF